MKTVRELWAILRELGEVRVTTGQFVLTMVAGVVVALALVVCWG